MESNISFLLGSGFSMPENLPGVEVLNNRLGKIIETEILIHSDQKAFFLNGAEDLNKWMRGSERLFVQDFIAFYTDEVLTAGEKFDYEIFYDFYTEYLYAKGNKDTIEGFHKWFTGKFHLKNWELRDCHNTIADFNRTFSQLLAQQLFRIEFYDGNTISGHPPYDGFLNFLAQLLETNSIKVHSLNHDLFFDWMGRHHTKLFEHYCDGFSLAGSPFYGTVYDYYNVPGSQMQYSTTYRVKIPTFLRDFSQKLALYKLHGSIDMKKVYVGQPGRSINRIKHVRGVDQLVIEVYDEKSGRYIFEGIHDQVEPDYLSGKSSKLRQYGDETYYKILFEEFEKNLNSARILIVIGYGFMDPGINEYLQKYLLDLNRKMVVVDPCLAVEKLPVSGNIEIINKGIDQMRLVDFQNAMCAEI
jgi:hypothetical protein